MFPIPSLSDCVTRARGAFQAAMPGLNAWLWPNNIGPTAKVIGAAEWSAMQRLDFVGRQAFALFAQGKYLDYHGAQLNLPRKLSQPSGGKISVVATDVLAVAAGAQFQRADGVLFVATVAGALPGGGGALSVAVVGPAGQANNTLPSAPMTIVSGVTGAGATGATAAVDGSGLYGGADIEPDGAPMTSDLATYRGRILFRKRNPPQGGSPADYVGWAGAVAGVTRTFVEKNYAGPGTARIFPLFDNWFLGGVPDAGHVALVAAALAPLEPAAATVVVAAAAATPINITVAALNPSTGATQSAVIAEFADAIRRNGKVSGSGVPIAGMPYLATPQTWLALWSEQAVADAPGVIGAEVTALDVTIPVGSVATPGTVTFV